MRFQCQKHSILELNIRMHINTSLSCESLCTAVLKMSNDLIYWFSTSLLFFLFFFSKGLQAPLEKCFTRPQQILSTYFSMHLKLSKQFSSCFLTYQDIGQIFSVRPDIGSENKCSQAPNKLLRAGTQTGHMYFFSPLWNFSFLHVCTNTDLKQIYRFTFQSVHSLGCWYNKKMFNHSLNSV